MSTLRTALAAISVGAGGLALHACSGVDAAPDRAAATTGALTGMDALAGDGGTLAAHACPTRGSQGIDDPSSVCYRVTPTETGAAGQNADSPHYALFPKNGASELVVFMNGSGGHPSGDIADPAQNFYTAATSLGYAVLAISYRSDDSLKDLCAGSEDDDCYFPTRRTLIDGTNSPSSKLDGQLGPTEPIVVRATLVLQWLVKNDPTNAWGQFLSKGDGGAGPNWPTIVTSGHSQGGGHASAMGKLFPLARVIQLSAVCDQETDGGPAPWTRGTHGTWESDPTHFWGLGSTLDDQCPAHAASWQNLGMIPAHRMDDAGGCSDAQSPHGYSIGCSKNFGTWKAMLE